MVGNRFGVVHMPHVPASVGRVSDRHAVPDRLSGVALLARWQLMPEYRVVCGLFDQHTLHAMHQRPMDSYTDAVDLMHRLNDPADRCATPSLSDACQPHRVQQAATVWTDV